METFVLVVGSKDVARLRARATAALRAVMPRVDAELVEQLVDIPEVDGALVYLGPKAQEFRSLIDVHADAERVAVVFGDLTGRQDAARTVHELSARSGWVERAKELDGVFAALVIDRRARTLTALTDVTGTRSLLWHERDGGLLVSPHLLGMVGTGVVPIQWDTCSAASAVCVDWSVGRRPMLEGVRTLQAFETLRWSSGDAARVDVATPIRFDDRIHRLNLPALAAQDGALIEAIVEATRAFAQGKDQIRVSLTRGFDSRAVLAFMHAAGLRDRVVTQTNGGPESADVTGAQRISAICGIPHTRNEPATAATGDFVWNARLTAFLTNGDGNSKQSLTGRPGLAHVGSVHGGGGGIYTGLYYPLFVPFGLVPDDPRRVAEIFMTRVRKGRWSALGAWGSALQEKSQARLEQALISFRDMGARGADLVDLLHIWERLAHSGAVTYRRPWSHGWTPFATGAAIRGYFRYPRGAAKYCGLHERAIREHLPLRAYLMPVNGAYLLPLRRRGEGAYMLRQAQLALSMAEKKVTAKLRRHVNEAGIEQIWAQMYANEVYEPIHAMLTDPRSVAVETFGPSVVSGLLERHRRDRSQLQHLGAMVTIEQLRSLLEEARTAGARAS